MVNPTLLHPKYQPQEQPHQRGYVLYNSVMHARYLPASTAHAFSYATLSLLLPLGTLERGEADLGMRGCLFCYNPPAASRKGIGHHILPWPMSMWTLTGIRAGAYLHDYGEPGRIMSIMEKLRLVLVRSGLENDREGKLEDAWMLTMPRVMGFEGINPLTVYFCYRLMEERSTEDNEEKLWVVVLEVHNTFGERHVYVLHVGSTHEDPHVPPGYDHSWTFPRQFHVSPFNDRSGYYTCAVVAPKFSPYSHKAHAHDSPRPIVRIDMYTELPEHLKASPAGAAIKKQKHGKTEREEQRLTPTFKLRAVLRAVHSEPLTSTSLVRALAARPFVLFLTSARILTQAVYLHYAKRLAVFVRPEPRVVDAAIEGAFEDDALQGQDPRDDRSGLRTQNSSRNRGSKGIINTVQRDPANGRLGVGGGIGWQPESILARYARHLVCAFLACRAQELGVRVVLCAMYPPFIPTVFEPVSIQASASSSSNDTGGYVLNSDLNTSLLDHDPAITVPLSSQFDNNSEIDTNKSSTMPLPIPNLIITARTPEAYLLLLTAPSATHALCLAKAGSMGATPGGVLRVNDEVLFRCVFDGRSRGDTDAASGEERKKEKGQPVKRSDRLRHWLFAFLQRLRSMPIPRTSAPNLAAPEIPAVHPLDTIPLFSPSRSTTKFSPSESARAEHDSHSPPSDETSHRSSNANAAASQNPTTLLRTLLHIPLLLFLLSLAPLQRVLFGTLLRATFVSGQMPGEEWAAAAAARGGVVTSTVSMDGHGDKGAHASDARMDTQRQEGIPVKGGNPSIHLDADTMGRNGWVGSVQY